LSLTDRILGKRLTSWILKKTFFGHFCGGETAEEIYPVIDQLRKNGVGAVLDYAAEADINNQKVINKYLEEGVKSTRLYEYEGEEKCDASVKIFLSCIETTGARADGFAAIKLTALGKPEFLERISLVLAEIRSHFRSFAVDQLDLDEYDRKISLPQFKEGVKKLGVGVSEEVMEKIFKNMDTDRSGFIEYLEWIDYLSLTNEETRPFFTEWIDSGKEVIPRLTATEKKQMENMIKRLEVIAEVAAKKKVRLMVDAEQTYFQPAIDHFVLNLQRKYNKDFPVIFGTYQAYLKDSYKRVILDLQRAQNDNFIFAAKIVRGAYMVQERRRAAEHKYPDPLHASIEDTHSNYHTIIQQILTHDQPNEIMVASHNEDSIRMTTALLANSKRTTPQRVFFGQLLGMCDYVSFTLGRNGFSVYKYLPYGPVHEVIPYLIRRAEENSDILGRTVKERKMLTAELKRRLLPFSS